MKSNLSSRCWNTIGVWSENLPSCEKLSEVIHCRNCEVYVRAGRDVFEKDIPNDYITSWTNDYSGLQAQKKNKKESAIIFRLSNEWFALPTKCFSEIVEKRKIQRVPHYEGKVLLGLINVRGQIRLCFSLQLLLGIKQEMSHEDNIEAVQSRNIVIQFEDDIFVFSVDEISGVYRFDETEYQEMPSNINKNIATTIDGILKLPDKQVSCLNPYRLQNMIEGALSE